MKLSPAYHLRTNKAVERLLFLELLHKLNGCIPVGKYKYVSLGGPYLEDFSLIHGNFGNRDMVSLEIQKHVYSRQCVNQPCSGIILTKDSTADFVEKYKTGRRPLIVWFDYEWPDWKTQIAESCELLQKLPPMRFKITLSGKTDPLKRENEGDDLLAARAIVLSEIFNDYGPFAGSDINDDSVCNTLYNIWRNAVADAIPDTAQKSVANTASYHYNDGTPILTVTMVIGPIGKIEKITSQLKLKEWPFADLNWNKPKQIAIPSLGLREKLAVDRLLPDASARTVVRKLKFRLAKDYKDSVEVMKNYIQFYRHVPQFLRVTI